MAGSGLQIFAAYPSLGLRGELYPWYPWPNTQPPAWLRFGGWLSPGRHWHFALAWLLVANAMVCLGYFIDRGRIAGGFLAASRYAERVQMFRYYFRLGKTPPPFGFYKGLQRLAYTTAVLVGVIKILSGLAICKPVQLEWLAALFGGLRRCTSGSSDGTRAARPVHCHPHLVLLAL